MAPMGSEAFGPHDESVEGYERPSSMPWFVTHRIVYSRGPKESESIEVMAWDRGADAPGPGRYALYTQEDADAESVPEWTMNAEGRVWLRNEALPGGATATVEQVWA